MQKFLLTFLLFFFSLSAGSAEIIGFRGKNEAFDYQAFYEYSKQRGLNPVVMSSKNINKALNYIQQNTQGNYHLYGFSLGAEAVEQVLAYQFSKGLPMPKTVITLGAYRTVNVDFSKYGVPFINFFDDSGLGNKSPGIFLRIPHLQIQQEVNKIYQFSKF